MKCAKCQTDNKETAKNCEKCGIELNVLSLWRPTWEWHLTVLGSIYGILLVVFFVLNIVLKPYMRQIPADITPWLKASPKAAAPCDNVRPTNSAPLFHPRPIP